MTIWSPNLSEAAGPRYIAIVEAIVADIGEGRLKPGQQMPTHRDLANQLGVTTGTITRAYSEAARRGLLVGETGRGTFVRSNLVYDAFPAPSSTEDDTLLDLSLNIPPICVGDPVGKALAKTLGCLSQRSGLSALLAYQSTTGIERHRSVAASWISRSGLKVRPEQVLICSGALHAMTVVLTTLTNPGDTVFTEALTYPGMKNLAHLLHLRLHGLPVDDQGILPGPFEEACQRGVAKVLYTIPTIQNPLGTVMPETRRREIAAIAARHHIEIIEDDVHSFMLPNPPPALSLFAPEHSYYILTTSKSLAGGMRIGYLFAPERMVAALATSLRATVWMAAPLMAEIASEWISDGTADGLIEQKRLEASARQEIASRALKGFKFNAHPFSFHLWLQLPEQWCRNEFLAQLKRRGVIVTAPEAFVPGRDEVPHAVRVCLGSPRTRGELESGLGIIREVLQDNPSPSLSIL